MKVRYLADSNLNADIVNGVIRRAPEIDFLTANEANLTGIEDPEVLAIAAQEKRILITHDRKTMPQYFGEFIQNQESAGIFIVSQNADVAVIIENLILIWAASEAEEYINSIRTLPF
ncbi:MAG TPA: DUF5615 family PIN-like protein [Pyrinomonadaceae bacterium]|jgi:hypothetical protein